MTNISTSINIEVISNLIYTSLDFWVEKYTMDSVSKPRLSKLTMKIEIKEKSKKKNRSISQVKNIVLRSLRRRQTQHRKSTNRNNDNEQLSTTWLKIDQTGKIFPSLNTSVCINDPTKVWKTLEKDQKTIQRSVGTGVSPDEFSQKQSSITRIVISKRQK